MRCEPDSLLTRSLTSQAVTKKRVLTSQAIYAILKRKEDADPDRDHLRNAQSHNVKLTKDERHETLTEDPDAREAGETFNQCWETYTAFYNKSYQSNMSNRKRVVESGLRPEYDINDPAVSYRKLLLGRGWAHKFLTHIDSKSYR